MATTRWRCCFNPHPPLLAGETAISSACDFRRTVSIHTRHYWRVKRQVPKRGVRPGVVSIHTRHYWRVKHALHPRKSRARSVSIHTRHYWRVKRALPSARQCFQCFNPHPPLLAGETYVFLHCRKHCRVSIHTRHYWRVKRRVPDRRVPDRRVSIHTRHYWRVKLLTMCGIQRCGIVSIHTRHYWRVKLERTRPGGAVLNVSIHTRHYWRVKRDTSHIIPPKPGFNPHPPLLAGETARTQALAIARFFPAFARTGQ